MAAELGITPEEAAKLQQNEKEWRFVDYNDFGFPAYTRVKK